MYVHFKRDLLKNQNYNYFNILLYIAFLYLTSIPVNLWKIAPINIAMVIFTKILEMHCLNCDGTKWRICMKTNINININALTTTCVLIGLQVWCAECSVYVTWNNCIVYCISVANASLLSLWFTYVVRWSHEILPWVHFGTKFIPCNSVYLDSTCGLSVLFHTCHIYCGLEPLQNYASLSLIAFANTKDSDKPVIKRSLFCYNL